MNLLRSFGVLVALLFLPLAMLAAADAPARPNVVFILTDNQGAWTLGCYGGTEIPTPNLDRLAASGARFANAFVHTPLGVELNLRRRSIL